MTSRAAAENYSSIVADAILAERYIIAARWLSRLNEILDVEPQQVFPSDQLLDHIPLLISEIAAYLRTPDAEEIAANTSVIEKARELGLLRHAQRASVHQLLREYEILGEILEGFIASETQSRGLQPAADQCMEVLRRLSRSTRTLMRTTVDTFVAEYTATLQERNDRIEKFNRMASHELRTPIGVLTFAAALLDSDVVKQDSVRLGQVATVVRNNVDRLSWLIENVQRLARIDQPMDAPSHQRVDVTALAIEVVRQLEEMAAARGVALTVEPAMPVVFTDPARLELILLNLISNGIKYSDPRKDTRTIHVGGAPTVQDDGSWAFTVRDNGLGIPVADQAAIFDRFFRAHEHLDGKHGVSGSGLGLSIVADCVNALGATISCASEPDQGTEFTVTLRNILPPPREVE
jgi:signal transduction histidine kinase